MSRHYHAQTIEAKWQQIWTERAAFQTPHGEQLQQKPKFYILDMFP